jgi:plastocyanin
MRVRFLVGAVVVVAGCGGGGDGGGGTPPPPTVASVTITPSTAQSTTLCGDLSFSAQARDAQGGALTRSINWTNTTPANVALSSSAGSPVTATGVGVGSSSITAAADGISSTGVTVTVAAGGQPPTSAGVTATTGNAFTASCVTLAAGGTVTWTFQSVTHNVQFGSNKPTGGDIPDRTSTTESRTFATAGNYPYQCTLHPGMAGRVIVQ